MDKVKQIKSKLDKIGIEGYNHYPLRENQEDTRFPRIEADKNGCYIISKPGSWGRMISIERAEELLQTGKYWLVMTTWFTHQNKEVVLSPEQAKENWHLI